MTIWLLIMYKFFTLKRSYFKSRILEALMLITCFYCFKNLIKCRYFCLSDVFLDSASLQNNRKPTKSAGHHCYTALLYWCSGGLFNLNYSVCLWDLYGKNEWVGFVVTGTSLSSPLQLDNQFVNTPVKPVTIISLSINPRDLGYTINIGLRNYRPDNGKFVLSDIGQ